MIAGYMLLAILPRRKADDVYDWMSRKWRARFNSRLENDPAVRRMKLLLDGIRSNDEISAYARHYHEWRMEDLWARWRASHKSKWNIRTEVVGLEHLTGAMEDGKGVVLWGISSCGTLFAKMALSNAGVSLTQLSSADHGTWFPLTLFGKLVAGPLHCRPEDRYIAERIRIPVDDNSSYLFRIGEVLKSKGCVWIAGERSRAKKLVAAKVLNHEGRLPMGAPIIALRNKATLLTAHTRRLGRFHYRVTIEPAIPLDRSMRRQEMIQTSVETYAQRLTQQILDGPGDWDWNHLWVKTLLTGESDD